MRLLNVFTGKLEEYFGSEIPKYAILSHTWGREEITFSDIQNIPDRAQARIIHPSLEEPFPELPISAPTPLKETLPKNEEPEAEVLIPESPPPEGPVFENKTRSDFDDLVVRYKKLKAIYFGSQDQLKQLQNELEKQPWGRDELRNMPGLYDRRPGDSTHGQLPEHEFTEAERILMKYKKVKKLYVKQIGQINHLQKVLPSWKSSEEFLAIHASLVRAKVGYEKILYASRQAIADGYQYVWIDTCCIDKSSSAELSEAINSMFQWYQKAEVCYAYVEDVQLESFGTSRWFTRGWTLQELLAPSNVIFFGTGWTRLGTKSDLAGQITEATGIDWESLSYQDRLKKKSIAQRMSWASRRETTRIEDVSYCLLGIFGVNMPLLYGEGKNAFIRLQEEILKSSVDQSLFAWSIDLDSYTYRGCGIFAQSPRNYQDSSSIVSFQRTTDTAPYLMTNKGLQIELPLIEAPGYVLGLLDCQSDSEISTCLAIVLNRTHTSDVFFRIQRTNLSEVLVEGGGLLVVTHEQASHAIRRTIYLPRDTYEVPLERSSYQIKFPSLQEHGFELVTTRPSLRQENVRWNSLAQSLHIVHGLGSSWRSVSFVFYNARTKMAFAVYFDEVASIDTEGTPTERRPIEVWLSPLVHEPSDQSHLHTLDNWWHSLSYGIDYRGFAYQRHPIVWFRRTSDDGITSSFAISAHLEATSQFGQKVRVLHVSLSPSTHPMTFSEGEYSPSDIWEPSSLPTDWTKYSSLNVGRTTSQPSNAQPPTSIVESYSTLEVVPSSLPFNTHLGLNTENRIPSPQILTKLIMLSIGKKEPPFFFNSTNIRLLRSLEHRDRPVGLRALPELILQPLKRNQPPLFFTSNSAPPVRRGLERFDSQIIPQILSKLVGQLFRRN